jgi:hypothetical protein
VKHSAKVVTENFSGLAPLKPASESGRADVVRGLLKHGATMWTANNNVCTALNITASEVQVDV